MLFATCIIWLGWDLIESVIDVDTQFVEDIVRYLGV